MLRVIPKLRGLNDTEPLTDIWLVKGSGASQGLIKRFLTAVSLYKEAPGKLLTLVLQWVRKSVVLCY